MKDWPRVAKIQSDLLAYALATGQTRVASYMLTKCQGLARFPWLGHTAARHHDYTHKDGKAPGEKGAEGQRILRDICRWHVEEFAYLVGKLKSIPEGDGTLLDNTVLMYVHEHAEAGPHKTSGMIALVAGSKEKLALGGTRRLPAPSAISTHPRRWRDRRGSRQGTHSEPAADRNPRLRATGSRRYLDTSGQDHIAGFAFLSASRPLCDWVSCTSRYFRLFHFDNSARALSSTRDILQAQLLDGRDALASAGRLH